jgi:hypothetical protein
MTFSGDVMTTNKANSEEFNVQDKSIRYKPYPGHSFLSLQIKNIDISSLGNGGSVTWHYEDDVTETLEMRRDGGSLILLSKYGKEISLSNTWSRDNKDRFVGNAFIQRNLVLSKHMGIERLHTKDWENEWKFITGPVKHITFYHEKGYQDYSGGFQKVTLTWSKSDPDPDASAKFKPLEINIPANPPAGGYLPSGIFQRFNASTYKDKTTWEDKYFSKSRFHARNAQVGSSLKHMRGARRKFAYVEGDSNSKWDLTDGFDRDKWTIAFVTRYNFNLDGPKHGPQNSILTAPSYPEGTTFGHYQGKAGVSVEGGIPLEGSLYGGIPGDKQQWIYGIAQNNYLWVRGDDAKWHRMYGGRKLTPHKVTINNSRHMRTSAWNLADFIYWKEKLPGGKIREIRRFLDDYADGKIDVFAEEPQPTPPATPPPLPPPAPAPPVSEEPFDVHQNEHGSIKKDNPHPQGGYADILIDNFRVRDGSPSGEILFTYEDGTVHTIGPITENSSSGVLCFPKCRKKEDIGHWNANGRQDHYTAYLYSNTDPYQWRIINYNLDHTDKNDDWYKTLKSVEFKANKSPGSFYGVQISWYNISTIPPRENVELLRRKSKKRSTGLEQTRLISNTRNKSISNFIGTVIPEKQEQLKTLKKRLEESRSLTTSSSETKKKSRTRNEEVQKRIKTKTETLKTLTSDATTIDEKLITLRADYAKKREEIKNSDVEINKINRRIDRVEELSKIKSELVRVNKDIEKEAAVKLQK